MSNNFKRKNMNKLLLNGIVIAAFIMMLGSCQYKSLVEPVIPPPQPGDTISFSLKVAPIWSKLSCTGCHPGVKQPDLTAENAYNSITSLGLVDTANPESSIIYTKPHPDGSHYDKYSAAQAAIVLGWIQEGARNN